MDLCRGRAEVPVLDGATCRTILVALLAAFDSSNRGVVLTVLE